ncbi:MAG: histidine kinase [Lachnospiraceae bacterium]|nr:histidine kinase [Lachnospiraceae bacterium]
MKRMRKMKNGILLELGIILVMVALWSETKETFWFGIAILILQSIFALWLILDVYQPIKELIKALEYFGKAEYQEEELEEARMKVPFFNMVYATANRYTAIKTKKNTEQMYRKQTQLTALQSQINPHFLYNTLDSIRGQALIDDNWEIAKMVEALASFFRYSISRKGNLVTLRDELANIENYMLIQRYRFNNRFELQVIIEEEDEEAYDFLIPRLIIQPIVENAIFHGLEEQLSGGEIVIEVIVTEKNMIITVSDNGKGIDAEQLKALNNRIFMGGLEFQEEEITNHRNTGIALPNIHKRIQLLFGEEYGVNVYSTLGQGTDVEITVPINVQRNGDEESEKRNPAN